MIAAALLLAASLPALAQESSAARMHGERDIDVAMAIETIGGEVVAHFRADEPLVLASNTKLLTTAAALLELPADYRWTTRAWLASDRLWLEGGGDPSLRVAAEVDHAERFLAELAAVLLEHGRTSIEELIVDQRRFDGVWRHELWPADQWYQSYCAPVAALVLEGGCLEVTLEGGAMRVVPDVAGAWTVRRTGRERAMVSAWWGHDRKTLFVGGRNGAAGSARLAVPDPTAVARAWLQRGLRRHGVSVAAARDAEGDEARSPDAELVLEHPSAWTLADAVVVANKDSDNFVAEILLKTLAMERGRPGSAAEGVQVVVEALAGLGLDPDAYAPADGSGMARAWPERVNLASPRAICALLRAMAERPEGRVFFDSLPVSDREGRLVRLFAGAPLASGGLRAKTGFITGASSLSGYLLAGEKVLVFSTLVNYVRDGTARTHNRRFRALQRDVLVDALKVVRAR